MLIGSHFTGQKMPDFFLIHVILRKLSIVNWQSLYFRRVAS